VETGFTSFVSKYPVPYVYGLTCGELALYLAGEGLLESGRTCSLTVLPMQGWRRTMTFDSTGLPWVPTSPHIPNADTPFFYVATGVLGELGVVSEGVGYTMPFRTFATEWIDGAALADEMNKAELPGVIFRPLTFRPFYGRSAGKTLHGVQIHFIDRCQAPLLMLQFYFLQAHHSLYPDRNPFDLADPSRLSMFDRVVGTDRVRTALREEMSVEDVRPILQEGVEEFTERSAKYRMYP
jgi:uncharacterized protein YbbC (DUF1343 family)